MLRTTLPDNTPIKLKFKHDRLDRAAVTTATITGFENGLEKLIAMGEADCHPNDNFCKATGRKLALARALAKLPWSKYDRQRVWKAYFFDQPEKLRKAFNRSVAQAQQSYTVYD